MAKIDIISGFLGAGKTTLIKKILKEALTEEKTVIVENEFGKVGIDGSFLKDYGIEIREINSGCICCTLMGDFRKSLEEIVNTFDPDRILIEPSGVAKLSDIIKAVSLAAKNVPLQLNTLITVADAEDAAVQLEAFGEFFSNQIENASVVVLSRSQDTEADDLEETVRAIHEHNPDAAVITTPWGQIGADKILGAAQSKKDFTRTLMQQCAMQEHAQHENGHGHDENEHGHSHDLDENRHKHCHGHSADEIFQSWGAETPRRYSKKEIEEILKNFINTRECGNILRAKGIARCEDSSWIYFDMTPSGYEIRNGSADYTGRLCVIGTDLKTAAIEKMFSLT